MSIHGKLITAKIGRSLPSIILVSLGISSINLFGFSKAQAVHPCPPLHRSEHRGPLRLPVCVPTLPPINPPTNPTEVSEEAWGQAGAVGYQSASDIMRAKNGGSQGLYQSQKIYLRPHFGDLVDRVQVVYNAQMMDTWSAFGKEIRLGGVESAAQTYCDRIYVRDSYNPNDFNQVILLAHELTHSKQCEKLGGMTQFGYHYFREYKRGGQNYPNNIMEKEAEAFQEQFAGWLSGEIASQNQSSDISVSLGEGKVINYFRSNGTGTLARQDSGQIIQRYSGWHTSWDQIVAIRTDMVLFYDREAGKGEIYPIEPQGNLTFLYRYDGWRKTWSNISSLGKSRVKFVDDTNHSEIYSVNDQGVFSDAN